MWVLCGAWGDDIMSEHNHVGKLFPTMRAKHTITGLSPEDLLFIPVKPIVKKRQRCTPTVIHTQKHLIRQQKLWHPKYWHHLASISILDLTHYSSLSCLTCCASSQTSLHSSAPEHEHTALLFSVTCHFKFPLFSFLCSLVLCYLGATSTLSL